MCITYPIDKAIIIMVYTSVCVVVLIVLLLTFVVMMVWSSRQDYQVLIDDYISTSQNGY